MLIEAYIILLAIMMASLYIRDLPIMGYLIDYGRLVIEIITIGTILAILTGAFFGIGMSLGVLVSGSPWWISEVVMVISVICGMVRFSSYNKV